jgi:hypothetical protein
VTKIHESYLCELAKLYYFHPMMKGSMSIKYVLPAVWEADEELRSDPAFIRYVRSDAIKKTSAHTAHS